MRFKVILVSGILLLAGCARPAVLPDHLLVVANGQKLSLVDPAARTVVRELKLSGVALDYGAGPDGRIYVPTLERKGAIFSAAGLVAVDLKKGEAERISRVTGDLIAIAKDGTAYLRTGYMDPQGLWTIHVVNTATGLALGDVAVPGAPGRPTGIDGSRALMPVNFGPGEGGNVYVLDRLKPPAPLFPFALRPRAPGQIIVRDGRGYFLYSGLPEESPTPTDRSLVDAHIDVWDLDRLTLVRRIVLPTPMVQNMAMDRDGTLYVGHTDRQEQAGPAISVVDPATGTVRTLLTGIPSPAYVQVLGDRLAVAGYSSPLLELFHLPDLVKEGQMTFPGGAMVTPLSQP
ncbi:MAG TPA: hypothetical protein VGK74_16460 [Symbiobacteriaceae bacterium]